MKKRIILIALLASMTFGATACSVTQVDKNAEKTSATQAVETTQEKRDRLTDNLKFKLRNAMKKKPLSRDWKVMRNGFKFFFKDLFI